MHTRSLVTWASALSLVVLSASCGLFNKPGVEATEWAVRNGVINTTSVNAMATRGQMAAGLYRLAQLLNHDTVLSANNSHLVFTGGTEREDTSILYAAYLSDRVLRELSTSPVDKWETTWSPDSGRLMFTTSDYPEALYVINADGTGETLLSDDIDSAAWSPDSNHIAFQASWMVDRKDLVKSLTLVSVDGVVDMYAESLDGSSLYSWSPVGDHLAFFQFDPSAGAGLYLFTPGGGQPKGITWEGGTPLSLDWSPDGTKLSVVADSVEGEDSPAFDAKSIGYVVNIDSGAVHEVVNETHGITGMKWSPDSSGLAFIGERDNKYSLWVAGPDGAGTRQLIAGISRSPAEPEDASELAQQMVQEIFGGADMEWSPDSTRLAFTSQEETFGLWVVNTDGTGLVQLASGADDSPEMAWSPDSTYIAYDFAEDTPRLTVWTANVNTGESVQVSDETHYAFSPQWSPDGARFAFYSAAQDKGNVLGLVFARKIVVATGDGSYVREVASTKTRINEALWSPSGTHIGYADGYWGNYGVHIVDVATSEAWRVIEHPDAHYGNLSWSPAPSLPVRGSDLFTDVPSGHWAERAIVWATTQGIMPGGNDMFHPDASITGEQAGNFLGNLIRVLGSKADIPATLREQSSPDALLTVTQLADMFHSTNIALGP